MVKLSTKQRYAVRIVVYLAVHSGEQAAKKREIARAEDIAPDYVEQICMKLKAGGVIRSHRGTRGGFSIARSPAKISVSDVLTAVSGRVVMAPCLGDEGCGRTAYCATRMVWEKASEALDAVLTGMTIAELAGQAKKLSASKEITFEI